MEEIVQQTRKYVIAHVNVGGFHGINHWDRVYQNGRNKTGKTGSVNLMFNKDYNRLSEFSDVLVEDNT